MIEIKQYISEVMHVGLAKLEIKENVQVEKSANPDFGDFSSNIAMALAKTLRKNPLEIAEMIQSVLTIDKEIISEHSVTQPGFLNFRVAKSFYQETVAQIIASVDIYGRTDTGKGKNANVEFVSANPTGPLTVGHGRQAVLGDTIANILEWHHYDVTREYYYNDAGRQMRILGQSVAARYFNQVGQEGDFPEDGYEGDYIKTIAKGILEQHGDGLSPEDRIFRTHAEELIFSDIKNTLKIIGINHDVFSNERTYYNNGAIDTLVEDLRNKDLIYDSDGATWLKATALGLEKDRVYYKSSGEPTYRLPDTAYHRDKLNRNFDLIIDVFGADHADTYPDVLAALKALGINIAPIRVLIHQFVTLLKSGEKVKMSTRKATFVTLEELIKQVGPDVVRYFFIMRSMNSHLNFELDLAADQSEKNPVYYLQYAHARICNIIKNGAEKHLSVTGEFDCALLSDDAEISLIKVLIEFPEVMSTALKNLEPQGIANYLHHMSTEFHKFYASCRVITDEQHLSTARLNLITAVKIVLGNGLGVLGISTPKRM
jgi:arginyl-tRNA synthetase